MTARVYVNAPDYVTVAVQATVARRLEANADDVRDRVEGTLAEFLDPEYGGDPEKAARYVDGLSQERGAGWAFGRAVYLSELYEVMERVRSVDHVESITAPSGAVPLERDQLPVSGAHAITVV